MPALIHTLLLSLAVGAAYWWTAVPELNKYSLQAIVVVLIIYFLIKRAAKAKLWHIMPTALSVETALATFALLLLIGSTGNTESILYPLTYIDLFLLIFTTRTLTAIIVTVEMMLFHFALAPHLTNAEIGSISTLPIVMVFFLFAKRQHEEVIQDRIIIRQEHQELAQLHQEDNHLRQFMSTMHAKLGMITELLSLPQQNLLAIKGQVAIMQLELEKLQQYFKHHWVKRE